MADRPNSTYDDSAGWRETYLREIPADRQTILRGLAAWVIELARESAMVAVPDEYNRAELTAAAADLRHTAGALYQVAFHGAESSVEHSVLRLVLLAGELAPQLEAMADSIAAAVAAS